MKSIEFPLSEFPQLEFSQSELPPVVMQTSGGASAFFRKVWAVARKDLQAEWRTKEVMGTMATFSMLAAIILGLAFDLRVPQSSMIAPGVLWVSVLFTGMLALQRSFGPEADRGSLSALLLAPVDRSAIYFGKISASLIFILTTEFLLLPVMTVIFDVNLFRLWTVVALIMGTVGYVSAGVMFSALTANTRSRETLLPVLLLPVIVPLFMAGIGVTNQVLDGRSFADFRHWLGMLAAYDFIFIIVAYLIFDLIWEEG